MPEVLIASAALAVPELDGRVAMVSDTRVSGVSHGAIGVHCAPEAAAGGPIALVQDGDEISFDLLAGTVVWHVSEDEQHRRRADWRLPRHEPLRGYLADFAATYVNFDLAEKQRLLETLDVKERLQSLLPLLSKEIGVLELGAKIRDQVKGELDKSQREYFLREQMKAIQKELGETDQTQAELDELRKKVEEVGMPQAALDAARRELDRLSRMSPAASEYSVTRNHGRWARESKVTVTGNQVTVVAIERVESFFGGLLGRPIVIVSADATAAPSRRARTAASRPLCSDSIAGSSANAPSASGASGST